MSTTVTQQPLYKSRIDLSEPVRQECITLLNASLATCIDLQTQLKQAHWNVKGNHFIQLHELFDAINNTVEAYIDTIAERITTLGGIALGTARMATAGSLLPEYPMDISNGTDHLLAVAERLAIFGKQVRVNSDKTAALNDANTADLFTEISREIDKQLWLVEAHLH